MLIHLQNGSRKSALQPINFSINTDSTGFNPRRSARTAKPFTSTLLRSMRNPYESIEETEWLVFRRSPIHGMGGFAKNKISKATRIIEYVGERIDKIESARRCKQNNEFIFALDS